MGIKDANLSSLADQVFQERYSRTFAQIVCVFLEREPDHTQSYRTQIERALNGAPQVLLIARKNRFEHRQLEIAIALATQPRLLLLDEPMAGMGPEESAAMLKLLRELKDTLTIVLVEHDMEAVFALADRVTVMVYGRIIACGEPAAIRNDPDVRRAYLGEQQKVAAQAGDA